MKKYLALLFLTVLVFSLYGCSSAKGSILEDTFKVIDNESVWFSIEATYEGIPKDAKQPKVYLSLYEARTYSLISKCYFSDYGENICTFSKKGSIYDVKLEHGVTYKIQLFLTYYRPGSCITTQRIGFDFNFEVCSGSGITELLDEYSFEW